MSEEFSGPSNRNDLPEAEIAERVEIFKALEALKQKTGAKVRMPNKSLSIEKLRDRAASLTAQMEKMIEGGPSDQPPAPKPQKPKPKPKPKREEPPHQKPKRTLKPKLDYSSDENEEPEQELYSHQVKPMFHGIFYGGCQTIGMAAAAGGFPEFAPLGELVVRNDKVYDPILDDLAKEYGFDGGLPLPPELVLASCLGTTMAHCYVSAHKELPAVARATPEALGQFFSLNLTINHANKTRAPRGSPKVGPQPPRPLEPKH